MPVRAMMSAFVKVFGCRPSRTFPPAGRPASENLQGTKPREGHVLGGAAGSAMGIWLWRAAAEVRSEGQLSGGDGVAGRGEALFRSAGRCVGEDRCGCCVVNAALERAVAG